MKYELSLRSAHIILNLTFSLTGKIRVSTGSFINFWQFAIGQI